MPQIMMPQQGRKKTPLTVGLIVVGCVVVVLVSILVVSVASKLMYDAMNKQAVGLDQSKDYAGEKKVLIDYLETNPPTGYRYNALLTLGDTHMKTGEYSSAFLAYEQARGLVDKPDAWLDLDIAQAAQRAG